MIAPTIYTGICLILCFNIILLCQPVFCRHKTNIHVHVFNSLIKDPLLKESVGLNKIELSKQDKTYSQNLTEQKVHVDQCDLIRAVLTL